MPTFIAPSAAFAKALARVASVVDARPLVPAAECVLLICTGSVVGQAARVRLLATNVETTLSASVDVEATENFAALIPAKKLLETVRLLPDQPVTFVVNEQAHTLEIKAERSKYKLTGFDPISFPKAAALNKQRHAVTLPGNVLRAGLLAALVSARKDNLGSELENVLVEVQQNTISGCTINIVGANNPQVSVFSHYAPDATDFTETRYMLSRGPAQHLASMLSEKDEADVTLLADKQNVRLEDGRWASRLAEGTYPAYERIMPPSSENTLVVDAGDLLAAVRRLDKYTDGQDRSITLHLDALNATTAYLTADNFGHEQSGDETLAVEYDGQSMAISFNAEQLAGLLALFGKGRIEIGMGAPERGVLITQDVDAHDHSPLTCLLMPLHVPVAV